MTDRNLDVAVVLTERLGTYEFPASFHGDRRSLKLATVEAVEVVLAALTAAGIACVYVPEGVAVAHGARLVLGAWGPERRNYYAIEDTP